MGLLAPGQAKTAEVPGNEKRSAPNRGALPRLHLARLLQLRQKALQDPGGPILDASWPRPTQRPRLLSDSRQT